MCNKIYSIFYQFLGNRVCVQVLITETTVEPSVMQNSILKPFCTPSYIANPITICTTIIHCTDPLLRDLLNIKQLLHILRVGKPGPENLRPVINIDRKAGLATECQETTLAHSESSHVCILRHLGAVGRGHPDGLDVIFDDV